MATHADLGIGAVTVRRNRRIKVALREHRMRKDDGFKRHHAQINAHLSKLCAKQLTVGGLAWQDLEINRQGRTLGDARNTTGRTHRVANTAPTGIVEQRIGTTCIERRDRQIRPVRETNARRDRGVCRASVTEQHPFDELFAIYRMRDRTSNADVAKPRSIEIEPDRGNAIAATGAFRRLDETNSLISAQSLPVWTGHRVQPIDLPSLERDNPRRGIGNDAEDHVTDSGNAAKVVRICGIPNLVVDVVRNEAIGPGANRRNVRAVSQWIAARV